MEASQIVVLVLSSGGLLGGLIWMIWRNLRTVWPEGRRFEVRYKPAAGFAHEVSYPVQVIFAPGVKASARAKDNAAKAVWASGTAWSQARLEGHVTKDDSELTNVIVLFASQAHMADRAKRWGFRKLSGYIDRHQTSKWGGQLVPLIVIGEDTASEMSNRGEPCIHECMHALERDYVGGADDHSNPLIWIAAAQREHLTLIPVQEKARLLFELN